MSSLTKLALKRPVSALLIVLALFVFGISSVFGFKMELTPDLEMPMLFVMTIFQGGDPETTEELVTKIIEDSGKTLSGVDSVTSQTTENMSLVMFSYEYGTDTDEAYSDLRSAIDTASLQLPEDAGSCHHRDGYERAGYDDAVSHINRRYGCAGVCGG